LLRDARTVQNDEVLLTALRAKQNLAWSWFHHSLEEKCHATLREVLQEAEILLGPQHPDTVHILEDLGYTLVAARNPNLQEGEFYTREALQRAVLVFGSEHPATLTLMGHMGSALKEQERYLEAEKYVNEHTLAKMCSVLGPDNLKTVWSTMILADCYVGQTRFEAALPLYRQAVVKYRQVFPVDDYDTFLYIGRLANCLYELGCLEEALAAYKEAWDGYTLTVGAEDARTAGCQEGYQRTLNRMQREAAGIKLEGE